MSAFPLQAWPSLPDYCEWLESEGGQVERDRNQWGTFTRLIAPDKLKYVDVSELDADDRIGPDLLEQIETRLGVTSKWTPSFDKEPT